MKKFKHTNLELEQARQESIKGTKVYRSELNRVVDKPKFVSNEPEKELND